MTTLLGSEIERVLLVFTVLWGCQAVWCGDRLFSTVCRPQAHRTGLLRGTYGR